MKWRNRMWCQVWQRILAFGLMLRRLSFHANCWLTKEVLRRRTLQRKNWLSLKSMYWIWWKVMQYCLRFFCLGAASWNGGESIKRLRELLIVLVSLNYSRMTTITRLMLKAPWSFKLCMIEICIFQYLYVHFPLNMCGISKLLPNKL